MVQTLLSRYIYFFVSKECSKIVLSLWACVCMWVCACLGLTFNTTDKAVSVIVFVICLLCICPFFTHSLTPSLRLSLVFEWFNYFKHFLYHLTWSACLLFLCCLINVGNETVGIIYVRFWLSLLLLLLLLSVLIFYGKKFSNSHKKFTPYVQCSEHFNNSFLLKPNWILTFSFHTNRKIILFSFCSLCAMKVIEIHLLSLVFVSL